MAETTDALDLLLADLDRVVRSTSRKGRARTFRQVTDLYFASVDVQEDEHVEFFDDVFGLLVDHVESGELADLSRQIAPVGRAPAKLIRRLANDDAIAVAGPVIEQSEQLTSDDLVMLANTKSQDHLAAIGGRERIDSAVTTVLVDRADDHVIKVVAQNAGAEFCSDGFARLAQRALGDDDLAASVGSRSDIPAGVLQALVSRATQSARSRILAAASADMKSEIARAMASAPRAEDDAAARDRASQLHRAGKLGDAEVTAMAKARRSSETVAALELLSALPTETIRRFMTNAAVEAMPVVCRAAGLSWEATDAVLDLCAARGRFVDEGARRQAAKTYAKLTKATADKMLRFWFVRGAHCASPGKDAAGDQPVGKRRRSTRQSIEMAASILVADQHVADATVEDISMEGAKLRLSSPCQLPDKFVLSLWAGRDIKRHCVVRWRTREHLGVEFYEA
jgi:uncharacterized protein (DUF2336 family)